MPAACLIIELDRSMHIWIQKPLLQKALKVEYRLEGWYVNLKSFEMGNLIPTFFLSHSQSVTENLRKNVKIIWMSLYGVKLLKLEEIMPDNKF